jgi:hypothetical protein
LVFSKFPSLQRGFDQASLRIIKSTRRDSLHVLLLLLKKSRFLILISRGTFRHELTYLSIKDFGLLFLYERILCLYRYLRLLALPSACGIFSLNISGVRILRKFYNTSQCCYFSVALFIISLKHQYLADQVASLELLPMAFL